MCSGTNYFSLAKYYFCIRMLQYETRLLPYKIYYFIRRSLLGKIQKVNLCLKKIRINKLSDLFHIKLTFSDKPIAAIRSWAHMYAGITGFFNGKYLELCGFSSPSKNDQRDFTNTFLYGITYI